MRRYGLIGHPLGHSASARYFNAKFEAEALDDCRYELYDLDRIEDLPRLLVSTPDLRGFNVTIPYKEQILPYLDRLSPEAAQIGAVNCVRRTQGALIGYNTDVVGLRDALNLLLGNDRPSSALILGTGGASRAVRHVLTERGIAFKTVSRSAQRGDLTYAQLSEEVMASHTLIIQATPVGTWPHTDAAPDIPYEWLTPAHALLDLIYNPACTRFLAQGRVHGAKIQNGECMFRSQAEASWNIWNDVNDL